MQLRIEDLIPEPDRENFIQNWRPSDVDLWCMVDHCDEVERTMKEGESLVHSVVSVGDEHTEEGLVKASPSRFCCTICDLQFETPLHKRHHMQQCHS